MGLIHHIDHPSVEGLRVGRRNFRGQWSISSTCIVYRIGNTVVDAGPSREWQLVKTFLQERKVNQALITHYHEDHSGNCGHINDAFNAKVMCHENSYRRLEHGFALQWIRKRTFGHSSRVKPDAFPDSVPSGNGSQLRPVHLPGHSDDMTCFHEPQRGWLFLGDLYVSSQIKFMMAEESVTEHINSLRAAIPLDFKELFCAHRGVIHDGPAALQKKLDFIIALREEVDFLRGQGMSVRAISRKLLGPEGLTALISQFAMTKRNVVLSCLRSLDE